MDIRQTMLTPTRDAKGTALLIEHFNQLIFVECRFFPPDHSPGIFFKWYDSLTKVPSCQRTVTFERASVLFNIAAFYTQIASGKTATARRALTSVDNFLCLVGSFQNVHENFTNMFPSEWEMSERVIVEFCGVTRKPFKDARTPIKGLLSFVALDSYLIK